MELKTKIKADLVTAMKARESVSVTALRMLQAEIKKKEIDKKAELNEADCLKVISSLVKQRRDSIEAFKKGGREDLAANEEKEIEVLSRYLPKQLSDEELVSIVESAIAEAGASSAKEMGKVMPLVMAKTAGRADGKKVSALVREKLS